MDTHKSQPPRQLPGVSAWQRILKELQARTAPTKPRAIKLGASLQEIASQIRYRQTPRFFGLIPEQAALLAQFFPDAYRLTLEQAAKLKQHRFEIPGVDDLELDPQIDWHTDPKTHSTWPVEHIQRLRSQVTKQGEPRVLWELSRFYHLIRLGQSYLYTQDESYAEEVVSQIRGWIKANPPGFGINWLDAPTVAIRVVNWIWAYYCIIESKALTDEFLGLWLGSLRGHGEHLVKHLERRKPHTSRLLASLAGLAYLGILFPEFPEAARWKQTSLRRLWEQLEVQVLPDGVYYEVSSAEQRFVTEIALSVAGLCILNGLEVPATAQARMRAMLDVIMAYTQPDGLAPIVGAYADYRLLDLTAHPSPVRKMWDQRHLLALGSLVLERQLSEWAGFVEPTARGWSIAAGDAWQDAFWCFASDAAARFTDVITRMVARPEDVPEDSWVNAKPGIRLRARALARKPVSVEDVVGSRGFDAAGLYIMRHQDFYFTLNASDQGLAGSPGSATLSFTLSAFGRSFLVDPGTVARDPVAGEAVPSRSRSAHNILEISGQTGGRSRAGGATAPGQKPHMRIHHWVSQGKYDFLDASRDYPLASGPALIHRRQIWFDKATRLWVLHDQVKQADSRETSEAEAEVRLWFHFAEVPVQVDKSNDAVLTKATSGPNLIIMPLGDFRLTPSVEDGWHSAHAGSRQKVPVAHYSGRMKLPGNVILMLYPHQAEVDLKNVRVAGRAALVNFKKALTAMPGMDSQAKKTARLAPQQEQG